MQNDSSSSNPSLKRSRSLNSSDKEKFDVAGRQASLKRARIDFIDFNKIIKGFRDKPLDANILFRKTDWISFVGLARCTGVIFNCFSNGNVNLISDLYEIIKLNNLYQSLIENSDSKNISLIFNALAKLDQAKASEKILEFYRKISDQEGKWNLIINLANSHDIANIFNALAKLDQAEASEKILEFYRKISDQGNKWFEIINQAKPIDIANIFNALAKLDQAKASEIILEFYRKISNQEGKWNLIINRANSQDIANIFNALVKIDQAEASEVILEFYLQITQKNKWFEIINLANSQNIANIFNALVKLNQTKASEKILEFYRKISNQGSKWSAIIDQANPQNIALIFNALAKLNQTEASEKILEFYLQITQKNKWSAIINQANPQSIANIFNALAKLDQAEASEKILEFYRKISNQGSKWSAIIDQANPQNIALIFNALAKLDQAEASEKILEFYRKISDQENKWNLIINRANSQDIANIFNALVKIDQAEASEKILEIFKKIQPEKFNQIVFQSKYQGVYLIIISLRKVNPITEIEQQINKIYREIQRDQFDKYIGKSNLIQLASIFNNLCLVETFRCDDDTKKVINQFKKTILDFYNSARCHESIIGQNLSLRFTINLINFLQFKSKNIFQSRLRSDQAYHSQIPSNLVHSPFNSGDYHSIILDEKGVVNDARLVKINSIALMQHFRDKLAKISLIYTGDFSSQKINDSDSLVTEIEGFEIGNHCILVKKIICKIPVSDPGVYSFVQQNKILNNQKGLKKIFILSEKNKLDEESIEILKRHGSLFEVNKLNQSQNFFIFDDSLDVLQNIEREIGKEKFKILTNKILALEFDDSNYLQFIRSRDEIPASSNHLYQRIQSHLYDVDCNFVYYIDPNNIHSFGEIKWQDFYKKITMQTQGEITGTYETSSSLQLQNNISIEMDESNYFSILMQLLKDDDKFMKDAIAFIESNEDKRLWHSFDEYLKETHDQQSAEKFKEKYSKNVKSLIANLNSNQELKGFIKTNFGEDIYEKMLERFDRHQKYIYLACEFVYEKYLNNHQDEIDVKKSSQKIKQDFKEYKKNNTKSKEEIVENLKKISRKIYELKGLKEVSFCGRVNLPKDMVKTNTDNLAPAR